jgi:hypothetical protein
MILDILYCKDMPCRLLSPQQWAQSRAEFSPRSDGTHCMTDAESVALKWDQRMHTKTTPLVHGYWNVGIMRRAPGRTKRFTAFCSLLQGTGVLHKGASTPTCFHSHVIPPDEVEDDQMDTR